MYGNAAARITQSLFCLPERPWSRSFFSYSGNAYLRRREGYPQSPIRSNLPKCNPKN
jgi:hypothetical protein